MDEVLKRVRQQHPTKFSGKLPKVNSKAMKEALDVLRKSTKALRKVGRAGGVPAVTLKELEKMAGSPRTRSDVIKAKKRGQGRKF
jgi:hypothetical protein